MSMSSLEIIFSFFYVFLKIYLCQAEYTMKKRKQQPMKQTTEPFSIFPFYVLGIVN